jgi:hypothetical protein
MKGLSYSLSFYFMEAEKSAGLLLTLPGLVGCVCGAQVGDCCPCPRRFRNILAVEKYVVWYGRTGVPVPYPMWRGLAWLAVYTILFNRPGCEILEWDIGMILRWLS